MHSSQSDDYALLRARLLRHLTTCSEQLKQQPGDDVVGIHHQVT